jgi:hypothetical protein
LAKESIIQVAIFLTRLPILLVVRVGLQIGLPKVLQKLLDKKQKMPFPFFQYWVLLSEWPRGLN